MSTVKDTAKMSKNITKKLLEYRAELIEKNPPCFVVEVVFPDVKHRQKFLDYRSASDYFGLFSVLPCAVILRRIGSIQTEETIIQKVVTNVDFSRAV